MSRRFKFLAACLLGCAVVLIVLLSCRREGEENAENKDIRRRLAEAESRQKRLEAQKEQAEEDLVVAHAVIFSSVLAVLVLVGLLLREHRGRQAVLRLLHLMGERRPDDGKPG